MRVARIAAPDPERQLAALQLLLGLGTRWNCCGW